MSIIKKIYIWYSDKFNEYLNSKRYISLVILILSISIILGISVTVLIGILYYIYLYWESLLTLLIWGVLIVAGVKFLREEHLAELQRQKEQEEAKEAAQRAIQDEISKHQVAQNYSLLRKVLFLALHNISDIAGLKNCNGESNLDSPNHFLKMNTFILYQYVVFRTNSAMDTEIIKQLLQEEINRLLENQAIAGLGNQVYYMYGGIMNNFIDVYTIDENLAYLTISLAIASDQYYDFLYQQKSHALVLANEKRNIPKDGDFE